METSPANRLPEADSLPDGFVESSSEIPQSSSSPEPCDGHGLLGDKSSLFQMTINDQLVGEVTKSEKRINSSATDSLTIKEEETASTQDYKEVEVLQDMGQCYVEEHDHSLIPVPGTEECLELHACKNRAEVLPKSLTNQNKHEINEVKRKPGKQNSKSEKELLELALKYQKVLAERDAGNAGLCGIPGLRSCGPHLSIGAKVGIALGSSIALLLLLVCLTCWWKRRQNVLRAQKIVASREASYAKARTNHGRDVQLTKCSPQRALNHSRIATEDSPALLS